MFKNSANVKSEWEMRMQGNCVSDDEVLLIFMVNLDGGREIVCAGNLFMGRRLCFAGFASNETSPRLNIHEQF